MFVGFDKLLLCFTIIYLLSKTCVTDGTEFSSKKLMLGSIMLKGLLTHIDQADFSRVLTDMQNIWELDLNLKCIKTHRSNLRARES